MMGLGPVDKATHCGGGVGLCRVAGLSTMFDMVALLRRFGARRGTTLSRRAFKEVLVWDGSTLVEEIILLILLLERGRFAEVGEGCNFVL